MPDRPASGIKPGHILFLTQTAHPWGGVENWLEYLVPGLRQLGWRVSIGLVRGRRFHDPAAYLKIHPYSGTFEVPALTGTCAGRERAIVRALRHQRPDIVVPVNVGDTLEAVRQLKDAGQSLRLAYPLHADMPDYLADVAWFKGCIDLAVGTNRRGQAALQAAGGLPAYRTAHVPYGVPPPHWTPTFDSAPSVLRLAYVGRLVQEQKRVRELPAVCHQLDGLGVRYHLDIAGSGDEVPWLAEQLQSQVAAGRVTLRGFCTAEQLYQSIYPGLAALVLLSDWETGPIVAWEAMRHGATVVTTDYRGRALEQLLIDESNSLVSPVGDPARVAANLARLATDPALTFRLRREAYRTANERCSIEASIQGWHAAFLACLTTPPALDLPPHPPSPPAGRLDRILGSSLAESVRSLLGRGMDHAESGGEWPHAVGAGLGSPGPATTFSSVVSHDLSSADSRPVATAAGAAGQHGSAGRSLERTP